MDYQKYRLSYKEQIRCVGLAVLLAVAIAYLFYDSVWGMILTPVFYVILRKRRMIQGLQSVQEQLDKEFLDALRTVSTALLAGLSMENAWREAEKEIVVLHGSNSILGRELAQINHAVMLNNALEHQLEDLAKRSHNADISSFAEVFAFAKRSGGNFVTMIEGTTNHIRVRYETEREIQVLVASKKLEQSIMNVVPIFILAYLKLTSIGFLDVLYRNLAGIIFMTGCLLAYGGTILLSERILRIHM